MPLDFTLQDGGTFTRNECVQDCGQTSDCLDLATSCQYDICYWNFCGAGAAAYSSCDAADAGDGECIPEPIGHGATTELCFQAGDAGAMAPCGGTREDPVCSSGNTCVTPDPGGSGYCYQICALGMEPQCPSGLCFLLGITATDTGICITLCNSEQPCPGGQVCSKSGYCEPG